MSPTTNKNKRRLIFVFMLSCILCTGLAFRVGWIQVVASERYAKLAVEQQTRDVPIPAKRGVIYDRNGKELAVSAVTNSIWARPSVVKDSSDKAEAQDNLEKTAATLAEILGMDKNEILTTISQDRSLVKIAKYVDKEKADKIRKAELRGIEIAEDVKRYYPMGAFAAHLLGSVTDDNRGLAGIELKYDKYLSGVPGRWIKNTDRDGDSLSYGVEKYYQAEDGLSLVLTVDEVIQHYVEKSLDTVQTNTQADRVMCICMDPKTGDILAMAVTPDYDPNNPRVPTTSGGAAYIDSLSDQAKLEYWNTMWRNPLISDTYEPGSTFKLLTTSIALEEGVTSLNDKFYDNGYIMVAGQKLRCWRYYQPHGEETLVQAVGNSCNPVFVQLAQRIGYQKYFDYMELFGLRDKTGIDYPGEGYAILQNEDTAGPVGLATMSYGQGIAVTPIQLITAVSALGNGGKLMQPRIVKELKDSDGNVVQKFDTKVVRQVVSKQTADEMCLIMEAVVGEGGGAKAKIPGYRIGGKTGTANKASGGGYSEETDSSFIGMAPMDDPQIAVLLIIDNPKGVKFGSLTAAPGVKLILEDTLRYMNIKPSYSAEEKQVLESGYSTVPDVTNHNLSDAISILAGASLNYTVSPATTGGEDFVIVDQYPKAGEKNSKERHGVLIQKLTSRGVTEKVKLKTLLLGTEIPYSADLRDLEVTGLTYDPKIVKKGYAFVCVKGLHTNGHIQAMDAAFRGASVIICEENIDMKTIPVFRVENSRKVLSKLSANFYSEEDKPFRIFGVTGTSGKTTITYMLKSIIETNGTQCGMVGTMGYHFGSKAYESKNSTAESCDLHRLFAEMRKDGIGNCVMEVSSRELALGKVDDISFESSVFSNLTSEHMDFHSNPEEYFIAKCKLFSITSGACIINMDDEYGRRLYEELKGENREVLGYSLKDKKADYHGEILETTEKGSLIRVTEKLIRTELLEMNTPGIFTIYNGLASLACARSAGYSFRSIQKGLEDLKGVPGRFELVENSKGIIAIVDHAHTPDALERVLKTATDFKKGRLVCIFGCGGDRDKQKRSQMGMVAGKYSDFCIITSDNPRTEKQETISADIEAGIYETGCDYEIVESRYDAIKKAVSIYKKGDIIMVAGKGHESHQIIGAETYHFDDREALKIIIENGE